MADTQEYYITPNRGRRAEADMQMLSIREELRVAGIELADNVTINVVKISSENAEDYKQRYPALRIGRVSEMYSTHPA